MIAMAQLITRPADHDLSAPPIKVENLNLHYDDAIALKDISFSLPAGQLIAVVGPNGAGKTTLFNIIAGTIRPSSGLVHVYGHGPHGHVCIAYVTQRSQVDWRFPVTVTEVVMMGRIRKIGLFRWPSRKDWLFVNQALERIGMIEHKDRQIGELSGGQQQRTFLAQALAQEAEVILLDEPLTGLDMPTQEAIFTLLEELRDQGVAIMLATHDLNLATKCFDQVMLLNRRLIAFGEAGEVFTRDHLIDAYGGQVHVLSEEDGAIVLADTCCEGGEEHHHHG
jgi:manganese/iron transport system ATP-binding protein